MSYYSPQANFNKGEISPLLGSRSDIDFWQAALKECRNFQILLQGGIRRRSGTVFVTEVADSSEISRLLPFVFNSEQSYILDVNGNHTIRFVSERAYLVSGASPYSIVHAYADAALPRLAVAQANDVMYLAHKSFAPRKITRSGDINWAIETVEFKDGPYLPQETEGTTLKPSATGAVHPDMTSDTLPSGTVAASAGANPFQVFDRNKNTSWNAGTPTGNLSYDFAGAATKVCDAYWITAIAFGDPVAPTSWEFEGYDGATWVTLDTRQGETGWARGEVRFFEFENETAYDAYRINIFGAESSADLYIAEMGWHESGDTQTPFNLTASSINGINDGTGFQTTDVGRTIRLLGSDGRWRWAKIAARTSTTVVTIRLYGHALPDTSPISRWRLGSFSTESGWPGAVTIYDERLMWARTDSQPVSVFGSKQGIFDDYGTSDPEVETDGLSLTMLSTNMNEILWLADDDDLITGSSGQIRSIGPADFTKSFSALNLTQKKGPTNGALYLQPLTIGGVVLYVGAGGQKIRELVLGEQNRYVAPELSVIGEHMIKSGIVAWAFSENPDPIIYIVNGDGQLIALTYDRDQKVVGFARHDIAGGFVEDVAIIPGIEAGYDDVYIVVRRTIDGGTKRYIEVLEKAFDSEDIDDAFFVDCGLAYSGAAITIVNGLDHLEGEEVIALADGGVVRDLTVSSGSVTLPYAASSIKIGLAYTSRAVTLPVSGPQQDGSLFGRRVNVIAPKVDVLNSGSLKVGAAGSDDWTPELYEQLMKRGDELFGNAVALQTGFQECEIEGSWADGNGSVVIETDEPLPLLIRSMVYQLEGEP